MPQISSSHLSSVILSSSSFAMCLQCQLTLCSPDITHTHNACQMPILLVKNLVVDSAPSSGIPVTRPTNHFNAGLGSGHNSVLPTMLSPLGNPGMRKKLLNFTPLGLFARCVTVGKSRIPALMFSGDEDFRRWLRISIMRYVPTECPMRMTLPYNWPCLGPDGMF